MHSLHYYSGPAHFNMLPRQCRTSLIPYGLHQSAGCVMFAETFFNNTPVFTAKGVEVVPFIDGCMTNGQIMFHDSCIDKPTPDNYTCTEQRTFQKCDFPFMTSALAAQWQGGFCQHTCQRCSCAPDSGIVCATVSGPQLGRAVNTFMIVSNDQSSRARWCCACHKLQGSCCT